MKKTPPGDFAITGVNALFRWIEEGLEEAPEKNSAHRRDSYQLKHDFARSPEGVKLRAGGQFDLARHLILGNRPNRFRRIKSAFRLDMPNHDQLRIKLLLLARMNILA